MGKAGPKYYGVVTVKDRKSNIYYAEWKDIEHHINGVDCQHKGHKRREVVEQFIAETLARFASQDALKKEDMSDSIAISDQAVKVKLEHSDADINNVLPQPAEDPEDVAPSIPLSNEQLMILDRVKRGHSVFITGPGGSGKSALLREIIRLRSHNSRSHNSRTFAITATTGAASVAFPGGRTLHSWAAIGQGTKKGSELVKEIMANKTWRQRWQKIICLVIDEVSMLDAGLFDKLVGVHSIVT
ncbi:hypothetical protein PENSPDRAFT_278744 [Peniophora sp. CONT]|nr:hypothetical protein PENSPDRAFT_278744 [Peniophora sp. CONT]